MEEEVSWKSNPRSQKRDLGHPRSDLGHPPRDGDFKAALLSLWACRLRQSIVELNKVIRLDG
jgi:hypothetical protein